MEAGNRCFDWRVPEEKNRKLIDHVSDWLLPYTPRSREYLLAEGIHPTKILLSGNPITDVLEEFRPRWEASDVLDRLELEPDGLPARDVAPRGDRGRSPSGWRSSAAG